MNEELFQYLSDEYMKCVNMEETLIQKKYELEAEKKKMEESVSFQLEDEKKRQMFSPLILSRDTDKKNLFYDDFEMSEPGQALLQCEKELADLKQKKNQLKKYIHSLSLVSDKTDRQEEEKIKFFPAFDEVVNITKKVLSEIEIDYDRDEISENYWMTFRFLLEWKKLFDYFESLMSLSYILIQVSEEDNLVIDIESISHNAMEEEIKVGLEAVLSENSMLLSWSENSFDIKIIVK